MKLSVIIPAFNEENYLPATLETIRRALQGIEFPSELIAVDNESTDNTAQIAAEFGAKLDFTSINLFQGGLRRYYIHSSKKEIL